MRMLLATETLDPETEAHYACHHSLLMIGEPHYHDFYEYFLVTRGQIDHIVNGCRERLAAGALVLIRPHDRHYYEQHGETVEVINLAFSLATFDALIQYLDLKGPAMALAATSVPPCMPLSASDLAEVTVRLQQIPSYHGHQRSRIRSLLADLSLRYLLAEEPAARVEVPEWLMGLMREMRKPDHFTAGLPRLYEMAPSSPEHLARSMKRHLGQTPTEWINDLRLHYAADLLVHTQDAIIAICMQAGFANLSHFYHLFQKRFGLSPAAFRKAHQGLLIRNQ